MSNSIRCIVGLGNPGHQYEHTRHNAGFWFVDELARRQHLVLRPEHKFHGQFGRLQLPSGLQCWLLQPNTYMNRSGLAVAALMKFYKIAPENLLVAHDELDLPCGTIKLKKGGGHGGHNGLKDIINALGSRDFYRLRIGIDHPGHKSAVVQYVLSAPEKTQAQNIRLAIERAANHLEDLLQGQWNKVMNALHSGH